MFMGPLEHRLSVEARRCSNLLNVRPSCEGQFFCTTALNCACVRGHPVSFTGVPCATLMCDSKLSFPPFFCHSFCLSSTTTTLHPVPLSAFCLSIFPFIVLSTLVVIFISNKPPPTLISFLLFSFIHYSRLSLPVSHFYVRPFPFLVCFLSLPPFSYSLFIICRICPSFLVGSVTSLPPSSRAFCSLSHPPSLVLLLCC